MHGYIQTVDITNMNLDYLVMAGILKDIWGIFERNNHRVVFGI